MSVGWLHGSGETSERVGEREREKFIYLPNINYIRPGDLSKKLCTSLSRGHL